MAKTKKTKKDAGKAKIKVRDMKAKKDPKGGALNAYLKYDARNLKLNAPGLKIEQDLSLSGDYLKLHK